MFKTSDRIVKPLLFTDNIPKINIKFIKHLVHELIPYIMTYKKIKNFEIKN